MTAIAPSNSRGMSWRKPVPAFIPTPPTSRPTSETWFTPAPVVSSGNVDKEPTVVTNPGDSPSRRPPVSPLFIFYLFPPIYPGECKWGIDPLQRCLITGSVSSGVLLKISTVMAAAFTLHLGPEFPNDNRFTLYVIVPSVERAQRSMSLSRSLPGLRLRWMITAHLLLGLIMRTKLLSPGQVDFSLSCYWIAYDLLRPIVPRHHLFDQHGAPGHAQFRACWNSRHR
jgi:hypothetical protein